MAPAFARGAQGDALYREAFAALDSKSYYRARTIMFQGSNVVLNKVLRGELMSVADNDFSFDELAAFVADNPDWPGLRAIALAAEHKMPSGASDEQVVNWFTAHPPLTLVGFYRFMDALEGRGQSQRAAQLIRAEWIDRNFSADDLVAFRSRYAPILRKREDVARLDRLLWDHNEKGARAMYVYMDQGHRALGEARLALAAGKGGVDSAVARVPATLMRDAGLMYERVRWRRMKDDDDGAIELLLNQPVHLGHADLWWDETNILIRRLIEKRDYKLAYRLVSSSKLEGGFDYVQAEFIAGWLALRFLKRPDLAHRHFGRILAEAGSPISRARGFYWIGRTYESVGQMNDARQAYEEAAVINTTFYGQLAIAKLEASPVILAKSEPPIPEAIRKVFMGRDTVRAIPQLYRIGQNERARSFLRAVADNCQQRVDFALLLELAYRLQRPDWAVSVAKAANKKNIILTGGAYPILDLRIPTPPELALTHALIRQESQFKADAGSPVGARGLMQLMPGTARDVAKKLGMTYRSDRLIDPNYNVKLGTYFIQKQIDNFDGSYILALAGYNAGPRRARQWVEMFGDPRSAQVDAIDWIELIPIYETRNYVQRIIENLQFYRARLNKGRSSLLILQDLKR
ncbi:MAG: lytic transglycosylase domain-containing protein [Bdellovibrionales bacterium]